MLFFIEAVQRAVEVAPWVLTLPNNDHSDVVPSEPTQRGSGQRDKTGHSSGRLAIMRGEANNLGPSPISTYQHSMSVIANIVFGHIPC